jgi:HlyD family secretion protein
MMQLQEKKKLKTGVQWLAWSGALALVSVSGWLVYAQSLNQSAKPVPVRLVSVQRGDVEIVINESGTVELGGQQPIKSPGEVTVDRVVVKVGDRIRFGQQLVILRNQERQTNLASQELEIRKQELKLARSRQKVEEATEKLAAAQQELQQQQRRHPANQTLLIRKQELTLERSRQKVEEALLNLNAEKQKLQQLEVLAQKGFIPGNELQDQKEQVRTAEAVLRDAHSAVSTDTVELQRLQLEQQPSELEEKVMAAQSELQQARSEVNTDSSELQRLKVERGSIQQQLQNNVVTAPISGEVLDLKVKDGDGVKTGDTLLTLGNPAQELVKLQLSTLDAAKVKVNQKARIKVIGPDAKPFTGRVTSLYPQAISSEDNQQFTRRQSSGQAKVPATVQLDRPSGTLIPGSQVSVEILQAQRQKVVALDLTAVQRSGSEPFVWIRDSRSKAQKRNVTLGLEGATTVEVKTGLRLGEQVIQPSPETFLEPGMPVVLAPNLPPMNLPPGGVDPNIR